jgi:hypothetical protein
MDRGQKAADEHDQQVDFHNQSPLRHCSFNVCNAKGVPAFAMTVA